MSNIKIFILQLPEYLLIAAVVFYWFSAGLAVNYIAIGLIRVKIVGFDSHLEYITGDI